MNALERLADFLRHHHEFIFHLPEYIESTRFIDQARTAFASFCASFAADRSPLGSWQQRRTQIAPVVRDIPAYTSIDWSDTGDWNAIPLIDKDILRANPEAYVSPHYAKSQLWLRETSGTTGRPFPVWYAPEFFAEFQFYTVHKIAWLADTLTQAACRNLIFCLAVVDNKYLRDRVWTSPDDSQGLTLRPIFDERDPGMASRLYTMLEHHQPAFLTLKPNVLESLLKQKHPHAAALNQYVQLIISGGADLDSTLRQQGQEQLGVRICNSYGLTEFSMVASECALQDGLHIYEHQFVAEVLQADGQLQPTGSGELVLSSVANRAMPLLRYKTGDLVEVIAEPCGCKRSGRRIRHIAGRQIRNFRLSDGSEFSPTNLNTLFKLFPIREFQITQVAHDRIEGGVEFLPECVNALDTLKRICAYIEQEMRSLVQVHLVQTQFERGSKMQRYRTLV